MGPALAGSLSILVSGHHLPELHRRLHGNNSVFDIGLMLMFGVFGYAMPLQSFEPAPLLLRSAEG
jgi:hypothetical protein